MAIGYNELEGQYRQHLSESLAQPTGLFQGEAERQAYVGQEQDVAARQFVGVQDRIREMTAGNIGLRAQMQRDALIASQGATESRICIIQDSLLV
jgi:hypothetical protein